MQKFVLNISNEEREKISLVLKVVTYFFILVWDLVFLGVAYWAYVEHLHEGFPQGGFYLLFRPGYIITIILIAVWVAARGMKVIGNWEFLKKAEQPKKKS